MVKAKKEIVTENIAKYLLTNTKIFVKVADFLDETTSVVEYDSRIDDVKHDQISIVMPSFKGAPLPVHKGLKVVVSMWADQGRLTFLSKVLAVNRGIVQTVSITFPRELIKVQLRSFFRVDVSIKIPIYPMNFETLKFFEKIDTVKPFEALLSDLSGGGCKLVSTLEVAEGQSVVLDFASTIIKGVGRVECSTVKSLFNDGKYTLMLAFNNISEKKQDKIVSYVFKRQIELKDIRT